MLNILLVEDEPPILRDIQETITHLGGHFNVLGTALNGVQALEILQRQHRDIDLMITDINIPMLDGLKLISQVRDCWPHISCAVLTGYGEFSYAQQGIRLGVSEYLLKPPDETALLALLNRHYEQKCRGYMQSKVYAHSLGTPGVRFAEQQYHAAVICLGAYPIYSTLENILPPEAWNRLPIESTETIGQGRLRQLLVEEGFSTSVRTAIFRLEEASAGTVRKQLTDIFSPLSAMGIPFTMVISEATCAAPKVGTQLQELTAILRKALVFGHSNVFLDSDDLPHMEQKHYARLSASLRALAPLFHQRNMPLFRSEFGLVLREIEKSAPTQLVLAKLLEELLFACIEPHAGLPAFASLSIGELVNEAMMLSDDYDGLCDNLLSIFADFAGMLADVNDGDTKANILLKVDAYIQTHYNEPINTKIIAEQFAFTPAYLSKIFREYKQISPLEYIVHLRMEKAKALLSSNPELAVKDVAEYVGYDDALYFSKVFKRITGLSPRQYAGAQ